VEIYQPDRKSQGRARERVAARQRRHAAAPMATKAVPEAGTPLDGRSTLQRSAVAMPGVTPAPTGARARRERRGNAAPSSGFSAKIGVLVAAVGLRARDTFWYVRHEPLLLVGLIGGIIAVFLLYMALHLAQNRIFPNVWALGIALGDQTVDEAASALQQAWTADRRIQLVDGERTWEVTPAELGLRLDAQQTAEDARAVGLAGLPFGYNVLPVIEMDVLTAQNLLLNLTSETDIAPYNAGYQWEADQLVGVDGTDGRYMDVASTLEALREEMVAVADSGRIELTMVEAPPDIVDPSPYLGEVMALTSQTFFIRGYDPFTNEQLVWIPDRDTLTGWLEAGENSISLREAPFAQFLEAQTETVQGENSVRYLEPMDAINQVRTAIETGVPEVNLRVHYRQSIHTVETGDSGYRIARRNGVSFYQLQQANPNRDWDEMLAVGEEVIVPSRDLMLPLDPVANKRIVIDLETQQLWAFENGQLVFNWSISSGMDIAPTSPGVYQILSHAEQATGSSIELCGDSTCGTWEMDWFMGIYEAVPGLVNGFHGAVLLPGGRYMGDGTVGRPWTYGCVMSQNDNAEQLYHWADEGTIVEIVSVEYAPQSDLARYALELSQGGAVTTAGL